MSKKKQTEIPGTERPTIDTLDEKIAEWLEARDLQASWKTKASERKAALIVELKKHAGELPKNAEGCPVYFHDDGEEWLRFTLAARDELQTKKAAPDADGAEHAA